MNEQGTYGGVPSTSAGPASGAAGVVKDEVQRLASEAKTDASRMASQAKDQAVQLVDRTRDQTAQRLGSLAHALRQAGRALETEDAAGFGRYAGLAADQVEKASGYLEGKDLGELVRDTQTFARRHPDLFLGGAFLAGVMVARFIKSSTPEAETFTPSGDTRYSADPFNPPHFTPAADFASAADPTATARFDTTDGGL